MYLSYHLRSTPSRSPHHILGRSLPRRGSVRHYYNDGTRQRKVTVDEQDWLARLFEENRTHLRAVAYRMLGSTGEADDAVQETWLRLARSDTSGVENLKGWLTTVVARVCLDALRSHTSRRAQRGRFAARRPWPTHSRGAPVSRDRRSWTGPLEPYGPRADGRASCSASRSHAGRSSGSNSSPTPRASANSTSLSS